MNGFRAFSVILSVLSFFMVSSSGFADDDRGRQDDSDFGSMHGYGGMGMMGGHYGGGMGMMGGPIQMLDLSDSQRKKINAIHDASRKKNWEKMGKMMDESAKLRDLYASDRLDVNKISATYDRIFALQKDMIRDRLNAHNQQYDILNDQQRKELKELRSKRSYGYGMGRRGGYGRMMDR